MLENVQNNVQEPPVHFFQRCTPGVLLSRTSPPCLVPPTKEGRSLSLSLVACPTTTPLVIPVDSFQFRIYRDLSHHPRALLHHAPIVKPPDSPQGPWTNEDRTRQNSTQSFECVLPCHLPNPSPSLSLSLDNLHHFETWKLSQECAHFFSRPPSPFPLLITIHSNSTST